ncbi:MAG: phenylalanine--tRNA ligase subunit beta, partial [bacterium]
FWGEKDVCVDVFHLKGVVESIFFGVKLKRIYLVGEKKTLLKPETSLHIRCAGKKTGLLGEVRKELLDAWDISNRVFVFEIDVGALKRTMTSRTKYSPIPKFPSIKRDLAVVVDESVLVGSLMECIRCTGGKTLKSVELFDIYRGKQIPSGKKSVAFSLTFLSFTRTLKEEEVDPIVSSVLEALSASFSARLRS